jgi:hypothetical protein
MAKHKFELEIGDNRGNIVAVQCVRCGLIAKFENEKLPDDISAQECKPEDASQAAARIVREATKD